MNEEKIPPVAILMTNSTNRHKKAPNEVDSIPLESDSFYANQSKMALKMAINDSTESESSSESRLKWGGNFEFLLSCVGYSVGLGNVWRFGYLCAKSGGGAFLIPYFITLVIVALPLMYMEFAIGQFTERGPIGALKRICPLLKGTGVATVVMLFFLTTYYIVIISWDLYFLFASFASEVPWKTCNNTWNTPDCWDGSLDISLRTSNNSRSPSEEYFRRKILNESDSIEDFGTPKWDLMLIALLAWIVVYFCIWKGVKSSGKVVYVTALFPYFVLVIMLVRGLTLEGSYSGLEYFFIPKWENLAKPSVWANAAIQNFNSMGVAFGALISMSSYNKKDKKIFGDVLSLACVDAATSIMCGCLVFSVLGYVAFTQGRTVDEIARPGPGLIFIVIPEALRNMSISPFWSVLFFLMIFMLGIDSQFSMVETVASTIEDEFNVHVKKYFKRKEILVLVVCAVTALLSIPTLCPGGIFYFTIIDFFAAGISVFYVAFFEIVAICWIYGAKRLAKNIYHMTGVKPSPLFLVSWYFVTPLFILTIWAFNWYQYEPVTYGSYKYPAWAQVMGWLIGLASIVSIPLGAIHTLVNAPGKTLIEKFRFSLIPTIMDLDEPSSDDFKGALANENRAEIFKKNKIDPETVAF